jgi:hypothetical protein
VTASPSTIFCSSRKMTSALPSFIRDSPSITQANFWDAPTYSSNSITLSVSNINSFCDQA